MPPRGDRVCCPARFCRVLCRCPARRRLALPSIPWAAWAPLRPPAAAPFVIGMTAAARLALTSAVVTALTGARHALLLISVALF